MSGPGAWEQEVHHTHSPTTTRRLCGLEILQPSSRETESLTGALVSLARQYERRRPILRRRTRPRPLHWVRKIKESAAGDQCRSCSSCLSDPAFVLLAFSFWKPMLIGTSPDTFRTRVPGNIWGLFYIRSGRSMAGRAWRP